MLSRFISKSSSLRCITSVFSRTHLQNLKPRPPDPLVSITNPHLSLKIPHFYSTNSNDNNGKDSFFGNSPMWNLSSEADDSIESIFGEESANPDGLHHDKQPPQQQQMKSEKETQLWESESFHGGGDGGQEDIFREVEKEGLPGNEGWDAAQEYKPWSLAGDGDKQQEEDLFDLGVGMRGEESRGSEMQFFELGVSGEVDSVKKIEEEKQLEMEEKSLTAILKGPNRAFGDLIAASGITDSMLESLIALKDFEGIKGLPPLHELQDRQFYNSTKRSTRAEIERQKQEEIARARVRQVDDKGRAYGTGRRKCSIARVWIQPGDGKFVVNDKEFDVYFPMLDHRAVLLRPFSETKTLGMWNVSCTVKGGGVSGQVGAIRLGISRALQNWAPDMRPPLKQAGFLTRDSRVVERKKPGKAKARKSFQWVKR